MTTPQTTPELLAREKFEAWAKTQSTTNQVWWFRQLNDGGYSCHEADVAWKAWQAALSSSQRVTAAPQEGVRPWLIDLSKGLPEPLLKFDDWLNAPPSREVPEHPEGHAYRFDAYRRWESAVKELRALARSAAAPEAPQPLAPPPGFALVPIEPTDQMVGTVASEYLADHGYDDAWVAHAYKSMLAAAPQPPASALPDTGNVGAESIARQFHEAYERLAPSFGYKTRPETRAFDPASPNGRLMIAVCREVALPPGRGMVPMDWQPMHSAPTSRPILLLWRTAPWPLRGEWSIDEDFDTRPKGWVSPESGWRNDGDQCIPRNQEDCIGWQDLPPKPDRGIKEGS